VKVSLSEAKAYITYDENKIKIDQIINTIEKLGYPTSKQGEKVEKVNGEDRNKLKVDQLIGIGIIVLALYIIIKHTIGFNFIPEVNQSMGYKILFIVGVLTSLHCVAMCGGINLSQCMSYTHSSDNKMSKLKPSLLYNTGRVISYTTIGGLVGAIGSVVSFSGMAKGLVAVMAGIFMIIMGINMLNLFPWLRKFNIRMPKFIGQKLFSGNTKHGPFYIGLLNGFMPCGPLQSMQLYALGTGSFVKGATSMFFFSLGTVPLMFGLGAISSILSGKMTSRLMKFSAILVVILGIGMIGQGLSLSGINTVFASQQSTNVAKIQDGVQTVSIELQSNKYAPIVVQKGIPVKFIINAKQENINGCNNTIVIPQYKVEEELKAGENIIEFLPEQTGTIPYSCWMGMIRSSIKVVDDITQVKGSEVEETAIPTTGGIGSCCN
ncbi:MAG: sulfite exporter TauE/SafE family protein, partial [Lutisporaceae bacterium]